jgi:hypothetical protein
MAKPALMIGPVRADQPIFPGDPDEVGNISNGPAGKWDTLELISANAAIYEKLGPVLALSRDERRTRTLDLDEISKVADAEIAGASVRGTGDGPRVVVYITHSDTGRSTKGMLPYGDLPKSKKAFEESERLEREAALAARSRGGEEDRYGGEDPRVAVLQEEIERLRAGADEDPEPYSGYADATVDEIVERIESESDLVEREILKRKIREYESAHKDRKGVLHAVEPAELVEADEVSDDDEDEDDSDS